MIVSVVALLTSTLVIPISSVVTLVISNKEAYTHEQGQLSDRYIAAADLLISDEKYGRVAGIEALAHVVSDFPAERTTVEGMLADFVRIQTPPVHSDECESTWQPGPDINKALTTISELNRDRDRVNHINLGGACLRGVQVYSHSFANVDFTDSDLTRAIFVSTDLKDAIFLSANLSEARFVNNDLTRASFCMATLDGTAFDYGRYTDAAMSSYTDPSVLKNPYMARTRQCMDGAAY